MLTFVTTSPPVIVELRKLQGVRHPSDTQMLTQATSEDRPSRDRCQTQVTRIERTHARFGAPPGTVRRPCARFRAPAPIARCCRQTCAPASASHASTQTRDCGKKRSENAAA